MGDSSGEEEQGYFAYTARQLRQLQEPAVVTAAIRGGLLLRRLQSGCLDVVSVLQLVADRGFLPKEGWSLCHSMHEDAEGQPRRRATLLATAVTHKQFYSVLHVRRLVWLTLGGDLREHYLWLPPGLKHLCLCDGFAGLLCVRECEALTTLELQRQLEHPPLTGIIERMPDTLTKVRAARDVRRWRRGARACSARLTDQCRMSCICLHARHTW
jgi:hypothetical protein